MNKDMDAQFLCKDCARYNLCEYYHKRKKDSYICKYFHLSETYGMTNGEVIQALFPQFELVEIYNGRHRFFLKGKESSTFDLTAEVKWLNAPYQKGGEE